MQRADPAMGVVAPWRIRRVAVDVVLSGLPASWITVPGSPSFEPLIAR
jgi:hypothetical protein